MIARHALPLAPFIVAVGCTDPCGAASHSVYDEGRIYSNDTTAYYESSPPSGPFLPYGGNTVLHVKHGLGARPQVVQIFLSFSEYPERPGGGGSSHAAGTQANYDLQGDDEIVVRNGDLCADYWIRIVATATRVAADGTTD